MVRFADPNAEASRMVLPSERNTAAVARLAISPTTPRRCCQRDEVLVQLDLTFALIRSTMGPTSTSAGCGGCVVVRRSTTGAAFVVALIVVLLAPSAAHLAVAPTVTTALSSGAVTTGTAVTDQATLSGVAQKASGTVTYKVFTNGTCTGTPVFTSTVTVTNATVPASAPFTATPAGRYQWQAVYKQFANQAGVASPCGSEPLVVTNAPTMTTQVSSALALPGAAVTDAATLVGATSDAGGTVTYNVYSTADCSGGAVFTSTVPVTNGSVPISAGFTTGAGPLYEWQAVYSGDSKNQALRPAAGPGRSASSRRSSRLSSRRASPRSETR